jgi:putative DNA primase/helicase
MIAQENISDITTGQWNYIHTALGVPVEWMTKTGKPCLMCAGHDRSSYDDKEGRGTYLCRGCGAGDGFTLLQKYHGWDFKQTADEVRRVLGVTSRAVIHEKGPLPTPPPKPPKTASYAREIWSKANTGDDYVAAHPYAIRKRIGSACGAGRCEVTGKLVGSHADSLIVPMRTVEGAFCGVECINGEGVKQSFGSKGILILGNDLAPTLPMVVFEGFASTVKWLDSRQWNACGIVSFGKGTAQKAAAALQEKYPSHVVLVGVEHD